MGVYTLLNGTAVKLATVKTLSVENAYLIKEQADLIYVALRTGWDLSQNNYTNDDVLEVAKVKDKLDTLIFDLFKVTNTAELLAKASIEYVDAEIAKSRLIVTKQAESFESLERPGSESIIFLVPETIDDVKFLTQYQWNDDLQDYEKLISTEVSYDLDLYLSKVEAENTYIKKDGDKVLTDVNFSIEDKELVDTITKKVNEEDLLEFKNSNTDTLNTKAEYYIDGINTKEIRVTKDIQTQLDDKVTLDDVVRELNSQFTDAPEYLDTMKEIIDVVENNKDTIDSLKEISVGKAGLEDENTFSEPQKFEGGIEVTAENKICIKADGTEKCTNIVGYDDGDNGIKVEIEMGGDINFQTNGKKILVNDVELGSGTDETKVNELIDAKLEDFEGGTGGAGSNGKSAYELAVENGFVGTIEEWLDSLEGASVYETWLSQNPSGTYEEFIEDFKKPLNVYTSEWIQISETTVCGSGSIVVAPLLEGINIDEYNSFTFRNTTSNVRVYVNLDTDGLLRVGSASTSTSATGYIVAKKNYGVQNDTFIDDWLAKNPDKTYDDLYNEMKKPLNTYDSEYEIISTLTTMSAGGSTKVTFLDGIDIANYNSFVVGNPIGGSTIRGYLWFDNEGDMRIASSSTTAFTAYVYAKKNYGVQNETFIDDWLIKNPDKSFEDLMEEVKKPLNVYETDWVQLTENVASVAASSTSYPALLDGINLDEYGSLMVKQSTGLTSGNTAHCFPMFSSAGVLGIRASSAATNVSVWGKKLYGVENKTIKEEWLDDNEGATDDDFYNEMKKPLSIYDSEWVTLGGPFSISSTAIQSIDLGDSIKEYNSFIAGGITSSNAYGYVSVALGLDTNRIYIRNNGTASASGIYLYAKKNYVYSNKYTDSDYEALLARIEKLEGGN